MTFDQIKILLPTIESCGIDWIYGDRFKACWYSSAGLDYSPLEFLDNTHPTSFVEDDIDVFIYTDWSYFIDFGSKLNYLGNLYLDPQENLYSQNLDQASAPRYIGLNQKLDNLSKMYQRHQIEEKFKFNKLGINHGVLWCSSDPKEVFNRARKQILNGIENSLSNLNFLFDSKNEIELKLEIFSKSDFIREYQCAALLLPFLSNDKKKNKLLIYIDTPDQAFFEFILSRKFSIEYYLHFNTYDQSGLIINSPDDLGIENIISDNHENVSSSFRKIRNLYWFTGQENRSATLFKKR